MPQAVFAIGAKVLLAGAAALGVTGTFAVATGLVYAAGVATIIAAGVVASKLISNLYELPKIDTDAARQRTVKSTIEPQKIIYGEALVSGPISFVGVYGRENRVLAHAVVLAGHECNAITDIHLDDQVISNSQINGDGFVTSGTFGPTSGDNWLMGGIQFYKYICKIDKHLGAADQVVDPTLNTVFTSIGTDHRGSGITYISTHFLLKDKSQDIWDKYSPQNIKAVVQGRKVYDPRQDDTSDYYDASVGVSTQRADDESTWVYSTNPVWCLVDYLTNTYFGMSVSLSRIDLATAVDAANACDVTVSVPSATEKRFTCNGILFGTDTHKTNINKILSSMNGMMSFTNGQFVIRAGVYEAPSVSLNEDNLAGAVSVKTSVERSERFNTVTGTFIDPAQNHKATEFPEVYLTSARSRDNGEILTKNIQLPMTNSTYMAQRIANKLIQQSDQQKVVTFPTNLSGMQVAVGDRVSVSLDEFNWSNKVFLCLGWTLSDSGNGGVNLILREDDSGSYADPAVIEYSTVTATGIISDGFRGVEEPSNLTATAGLKSIELNWTNPLNMDGILFIEVFASPDSAWANRVKIGEVNGTQFMHDASNAADSVSVGDTRYYWIRARAYSDGEDARAVSDRNPDNDISTITATVGSIPWDDVAGDDKPADNATVGATIGTDLKDASLNVVDEPNVLNRNAIVTITTDDNAAPSDTEFSDETGRNPRVGDIAVTRDTSGTVDITYAWKFNGTSWDSVSNLISGDLVVDGSITADNLAANSVTSAKIDAGAITTEKLLVKAKGAALNADPNVQDPTAWVKYADSDATFTTVTDGEVGVNVIRSAAAGSWYNGSDRLALDPSKTYRMTFVARKSSTANGTVYGGVAAFTSSGANISGDGSQWSYDAASNNSGSTDWVRYSMDFGAGTSNTFPANAASFAPLVILNYQGTTGYFEAQDIRIEEKISADLIVDGTVTADKLVIDGITLDSDGSGNLIVKSGGIDTTQLASSAVETAKIANNAVSSSTFVNGVSSTFLTNSTSYTTIATMTVTRSGANARISGGGIFAQTTGGVIYSSQYAVFDMRLVAYQPALPPPLDETVLLSVTNLYVGGYTTPSIRLEDTHVSSGANWSYYLQVRKTGGTSSQIKVLNSYESVVELKK